jgi:hypothetical protein
MACTDKEKRRAYYRSWRKANPDKALTWKKANPEKVRANKRAYYLANRKKILKIMRIQYAANPNKKRNSSKSWAKDNPEKVRVIQSAWYKANKDKSRERLRAWRSINRDRENANRRALYSTNPDKRRNTNLSWKEKNLEHCKKYALKKHHYYYKNNPEYRIALLLRSRLRAAIKKYRKDVYSKPGSAVKDLGCSVQEFISYLSEKFQPGMTMENIGEWHLDHVRPLASFNLLDTDQFKQACHFSNYQPLWALDNLKKGAKFFPPINEAA